MKQLFCSKTCPFDLKDWQTTKIEKLFAGRSCIMALTTDGKVLQKVSDENFSARTHYWNNIKSISISNFFTALAVGLVNDGTCMVSKRALRRCCEITGTNFDHINEQIKALKNIVEIAVSDAIFALDSFGKIHHISLWKDDVYKEANDWCDICHIAVGSQDSLFGITKCGRVLCAGADCIAGPHGNLQNQLSNFQNIVDVCAMGSECERVMLALSDGKVIDCRGNDLNIEHCGRWPVFRNNFRFAVAQLKNDKLEYENISYGGVHINAGIKPSSIHNIAIGMDDAFTPFVIWCRNRFVFW